MPQDFKFNASLKDSVTPNLGKIEGKLRSVQSALSGFVSKFRSSSDDLGSSSKKSSTEVTQNLGNLDKSLKRSAKNFENLGKSASRSSEKVGKAVQDSLYGKSAEERVTRLDQDLGKLGKTFDGMASRQRAVSGKARVLGSSTRDSINKKVIPAFQELHATLDDYPDVLRDINKLESERFDMLEKHPGMLGKVRDGLTGVNEGLKKMQFGLSDAMAVITTGYVGHVGLEVQDTQKQFAQIGGAEGYGELVETLRQATLAAKAPIQELEPMLLSIRDARSIAQDALPEFMAGIYDMSKGMNVAAEELAGTYDRLTRIQGLNEASFGGMMDAVQGIANESVVSQSELVAILNDLGPEMLSLSQEARQTYARSALAAAAVARDSGLDANSGKNLQDTILDDPREWARLQGIMNATGGGDLRDYVKDQAKLQEMFSERLGKQFGNMDVFDPVQRQGYRAMVGSLDPNIERLQRKLKKTGEGTGGTEDFLTKDYTGTLAGSAKAARSGMLEKTEQSRGLAQSATVVTGEKLIRSTATVIGKMNEMAEKGIVVFDKMDKKFGGLFSTGAAAATLGGAAFGLGKFFLGGKETIGGVSNPFNSDFSENSGKLVKVAATALALWGAKKTYDFVKGSTDTKEVVKEVSNQEKREAHTVSSFKPREVVGETKKQLSSIDMYDPVQRQAGRLQRQVDMYDPVQRQAGRLQRQAGRAGVSAIDDKQMAQMLKRSKGMSLWFENVKESFGRTFESLKRSFINLREAIKPLTDPLIKATKAMFNFGKTVVKVLGSIILTKIKIGIGALVAGIEIAVKFIEKLTIGIRVISKIAETAFKAIWSVGKTVTTFLNPLKLITIGFEKLGYYLVDLKEIVPKVSKTVYESFKSVNKTVTTFLNPLKLLEKGFETLGYYFEDIKTFIADFDLKEFWSNIFNAENIKDVVKDFWKSIFSFFGKDKEDEVRNKRITVQRADRESQEMSAAQLAERAASQTITGDSIDPPDFSDYVGTATPKQSATNFGGFRNFRNIGDDFTGFGVAPTMDGSKFTTVGGGEMANATPLAAGQRSTHTLNPLNRPSKNTKTITPTTVPKTQYVAGGLETPFTNKNGETSEGTKLAKNQLSVQEQMLAHLAKIAENTQQCCTPEAKSKEAAPSLRSGGPTPGEQKAFSVNAWAAGNNNYGAVSIGGSV